MEIIKNIINNKRKSILTISVIIIVIILIVIFMFLNYSNQKANLPVKEEESLAIDKSPDDGNQKEVIKYNVDIKGAVNAPGVYLVDEGSNVLDVIKMAGGLKDNGDTSVINLSKRVFDQMVIIIYTKDEVSNFSIIKEKEELNDEKCQNDEVITNDACKENEQDEVETKKININTANITLLMTLTGIGESKAIDIITYRTNNGLFTKIEDLMNVSGIGEATFAKIKENITV